jgi:hypothetical protein
MDIRIQCTGRITENPVCYIIFSIRRFNDFATLHSDVQQHFKGHHLLSRFDCLCIIVDIVAVA